MCNINIQGFSGLSEEELQILTRQFHRFAETQRESGYRYENMTSLLEDFFKRSGTSASIVTDPKTQKVDITYSPLKGTFELPEPTRTLTDPLQTIRSTVMQETMINISDSLRPGLGR